MAAIASEVEVSGRAEDVFSYVTDPSRFPEWQQGVVSGRMEGGGPHGVGAKCITTRRIGGAERAAMSEVTEVSPPRSRVKIEVDFEGYGIGKLLVALVVRRQAAKGNAREHEGPEGTDRERHVAPRRLLLMAGRGRC